MLYSHFWDWVRFLVFGIKSIAYFLFSVCGNWGITIILLALCMRILIFPLTTLADKYQKEALQNQQLLQPEISRIKKENKELKNIIEQLNVSIGNIGRSHKRKSSNCELCNIY